MSLSYNIDAEVLKGVRASTRNLIAILMKKPEQRSKEELQLLSY